MEIITSGNLALRFLLELCALVALGYWGFRTGSGLFAKIGLGIGVPLLTIMIVKDSRVPADGRAGTLMKEGRWIAFAGCAYVVAWIVGLAIGFATASPGPADSISTIGAYFSSHREAAMIQAYFLDGIAGASLIVFVAALRSFLRRFEGESATLSSILFGAGVAAGTVSLLQGLFTQVLADHVATMGNAAAIRTLFDLNGEGDTYKLLALGVFLGAVALLALRTHALPRWIGWVAAVLAPLLVIAGWNFALSSSIQYAAYTVLLIVLLVWVAAVSVISGRRAARGIGR
jgi:hypothetical protein